MHPVVTVQLSVTPPTLMVAVLVVACVDAEVRRASTTSPLETVVDVVHVRLGRTLISGDPCPETEIGVGALIPVIVAFVAAVITEL